MAADDQLRVLTAIHEAGHVAAWLAAGRQVWSVWIDDHGNGRVRPLAQWCWDNEFLARAALAGPVAEAYYQGAPGALVDLDTAAARTDITDALHYLHAQVLPRRLVTDVERLVITNWTLIIDLAAQLHGQGRLTYRQLAALRNQHVPSRAGMYGKGLHL